MKLAIVTICLDAQPWITHHLPVFEASGLDFRWFIREGAAMNTHCTRWCRPQQPRLSNDGTHEYLMSIASNPRVDLKCKPSWDGKVNMFNDALEQIKEPCLLLEVDSDELYESWQLINMVELFDTYPHAQRAYFWCYFYVGPNIITTTPNAYGNNPSEWLRMWRYTPGQRFQSHEAPVLDGNKGPAIDRDTTGTLGLIFRHMAYATEKSVAFKEEYYGYKGAVQSWRRLQQNKKWPVKLRSFLPWSDDRAMVDRITSSPLDLNTPRH